MGHGEPILYPSGTQQDESDERTAGGPINNNEIQPSVSLREIIREMKFHFMALLGNRLCRANSISPQSDWELEPWPYSAYSCLLYTSPEPTRR